MRPEPARLAAAMKRFTLLLQVLGAGAVSDTVCDEAGLQQSPPVCQRASQSGTAHMPTVFGGPATLGQCVYGHFHDQQSNYGGGASCWTGALFAFSGIVTRSPQSPPSQPPPPTPPSDPLVPTRAQDGTTSVNSDFVGWFVNGSYSVYLWGPSRHLRLGFGRDALADPEQDTVLEATNDVLLVKRGESAQIGVTWRDWRTIVGFVEGDAVAQMEETTGHGGSHRPPPPASLSLLSPPPPPLDAPSVLGRRLGEARLVRGLGRLLQRGQAVPLRRRNPSRR